MKRVLVILLASCLSSLALAGPAGAAFGIKDADVTFTNEDGSRAVESGSHPYEMKTTIDFNTVGENLEGEFRDVVVDLPTGFVGDPLAVPRCTNAEFLEFSKEEGSGCPNATAVGVVGIRQKGKSEAEDFGAIYNLEPAPGMVAKLGFHVLVGVVISVDVGVRPDGDHNVFTVVRNSSQAEPVSGAELTIWGNPADPSHDSERGNCKVLGAGVCETDIAARPFLTLPRTCEGPLITTFRARSWDDPNTVVEKEAVTEDEAGNPLGLTDCGSLPFSPTITAKPTTKAARSPTGLDFSLDVKDEGLVNPAGRARSDIRKTVVTLPEGFTTNPSIAEGLSVCGEEDLARETLTAGPGEGCPEASKIGTVEVESQLLEENVNGALYIAEPYENPFGSLLALYIVIKNTNLGIIVKQAAEVTPDPLTGRLTTIVEDIPQLPFSHFRLHFREGSRSPLASPPGCGTFEATAELTPWSGGAATNPTSAFQIISGSNGTPCPQAGLPPFRPELRAGTVNNAAGAFSPFNVSLTRNDSEQEITNFSIKLPPGVAGKLAGIAVCSEEAIARARSRTGPHGGAEELADPSCPAASRVGRTLAGAGVGPSLAYSPGGVYLAGPYNGRPLSMVAVTAGVVGPFDIGTVVVRLAIDINPETGEVFLDSTGSDPIPHIIKGVPLHVRDIRAYTDRPQFTYNPTSCEPTSTSATVLGSGLDFASTADNNPFVSTSPFQAADCAALSFKPKLSFKLKGTTRRGGNPSLRAHVGMNGFGEAAIRYAQVTLPKSEFLEQSHIGTICTRVQYNAGQVPGEKCPAASVYGKVVARTPILDGALSGPIFLRSNGGERDLPDLVAALHGQFDVTLVGFIDSGKNGGIRNTFAFVPDAPVTSADFTFFGGKKSLLSNSRNLCRSVNKVGVELKAHSGKELSYKTPLKPMGCKKGKQGRKSKSGTRRGR
jgi:hypothetical protein